MILLDGFRKVLRAKNEFWGWACYYTVITILITSVCESCYIKVIQYFGGLNVSTEGSCSFLIELFTIQIGVKSKHWHRPISPPQVLLPLSLLQHDFNIEPQCSHIITSIKGMTSF